LELRNGKINYKITYLNPTTHASQKFIIYYDPVINKVLILNSVSLPSAQQFTELSDTEMGSDSLLAEILKLVNKLHSGEMDNYKLQCVSKGTLAKYTEYHITWSSNGRQYRSFVRSENSNAANLVETLFGEVETISLDHYRLDEFEKMFILNYQILTDDDLRTDPNFRLILNSLRNANTTLKTASLIGAAQKPLSLGFVYHVFFRLASGEIDRAEVYIELYSNKLTLKELRVEDFTSSMVSLSQSDNSTKKVLGLIAKQATNPPLESESVATSVLAKDFLFGRLFNVEYGEGVTSHSALVYHDHSSEQAQLLSWGETGAVNNCLHK
jgi:hypothetical protein